MTLRIGAQLAETAESSCTVRRSLRLRNHSGGRHWGSTGRVPTQDVTRLKMKENWRSILIRSMYIYKI